MSVTSFCFGTKVAVVTDKYADTKSLAFQFQLAGFVERRQYYDVAHFPSSLCVPVHLRRLFSNCDSKKEVEKKRQVMLMYRGPNN